MNVATKSKLRALKHGPTKQQLNTQASQQKVHIDINAFTLWEIVFIIPTNI
jgi:hypothetical protein